MQIPKQVLAIIKRIEQNGGEAFVVGGCVRDYLMNNPPHDWDICTSFSPQQIKDFFTDLTIIETGIKHGTLTLISDGTKIEVTTYRIDGIYSDNRHPQEITFTDNIRADLARRDFTVNAIAFNPQTGFIDPFGGCEDIKNAIIKTVGSPQERFNEDALRIMRALRFAAVLNFKIEKDTAHAIHLDSALLNNISAERIRDELVKLICGQNCESVLNDFSDVLGTIIPEIIPTVNFEQKNPNHCFTVWRHITKAVSSAPSKPLIRLALLFHDLGKAVCCTEDEQGIRHFHGHPQKSAEITQNIMHRLRFDKQTIDKVYKLVLLHDTVIEPDIKCVKRFINNLGVELMPDMLEIRTADIKAQSEYNREIKIEKLNKVKEIYYQILQENSCLEIKDLQIDGNDLIACGIPEGPQIKKTLQTLLYEVIDEKIANDTETLKIRAQQLFKQIP